MFATQNLYLYFIASLPLNLTPGNDMIYVSSRCISQDTKAGYYSALGVFLGCIVHIFAAILRISLIIARSAFLFGIVKIADAAYLVYLGIKALTIKSNFENKIHSMPIVNKSKLIKQGFITNTLNPKVAILFLSFLPQFVDRASPPA